jgi:hypothetical protein
VIDRKTFDRLKGLYRQALEEIERLKKLPSEGRTVLAVPDSCWTCVWFSGEECMRHRSPVHGQRLEKPKETVCGYYLHTKYPRGEIIAKVGTPEWAKGSERPQAGSYAKCAVCGHTIKVTESGRLFRHDSTGKLLRRRGGVTPCPGMLADDTAITLDEAETLNDEGEVQDGEETGV